MPASEPDPTSADFITYASRVIRIVEAQHKISTDRVADGPLESEIAERLAEEVKPNLPPSARGLHHLLGTPFRYGYDKETRFRQAHEWPGIFYASERMATAVAERAYWLMRFFSAATAIRLPTTTIEFWAFSVAISVERAIDLTRQPFVKARKLWTRPDDYHPCQRLAAKARPLGTQLIRYESVRDEQAGANVALFDPAAFQEPVPSGEGSWHFRFRGSSLTAFAALPSAERHDFTFEQFGLAAS